MCGGEFGGEVSHAGAAEHDGFRPIVADRGGDLRGDLAESISIALLEREHRDLGGADASAALGETVFPQIMLDRHDRDTEGRHHGKTRRDQARHVEAGFPDADHRRFRGGTRGVEAGVVEAGDDVGVGAVAVGVADAAEHAGHGEGFVVKALDRDRAHRGLARIDQSVGQGDAACRSGDLRRHRRGGVGIDDVQPHQFRQAPCQTSPWPASEPLAACRLLSMWMVPSARAITVNDTAEITVPSA